MILNVNITLKNGKKIVDLFMPCRWWGEKVLSLWNHFAHYVALSATRVPENNERSLKSQSNFFFFFPHQIHLGSFILVNISWPLLSLK